MAGTMILPEVIQRKSLFSLLYEIDQDLCEQTRACGCPIAGGRCTVPTTRESLGVGPLIFARLLRSASACAAVRRVAGAGYYRHRCGSGSAGSTGRRWCWWSAPFGRDKIRTLPLSGSRGFAGYGAPRSNAGCGTLKSFSPTASTSGDCPVTCCHPSVPINCQGTCWHGF
jgi:hypothetical protein